MVQTSRIPYDSPEWDALVTGSGGATPFHTAAWARVLAATYGHQPWLYRITGDAGQAELVAPIFGVHSQFTGRRGHCVPFADRCAPLLGSRNGQGLDRAGMAQMFSEAIAEIGIAEHWKSVEIRGAEGVPPQSAPTSAFVRHEISFEGGSDAVRARFHPSVRRAIRKAENSGLVVRTAAPDDATAMGSFYGLHCRTRRRHGLPPQPLAFFDALQKHFIARGAGMVVLVEKKAVTRGVAPVVIAAAVFLVTGATAVYKFGASDSESWNLRPNNLIFWHAIREFLAVGRVGGLDLGRSDIDGTGLRQFKSRWGGAEEPLHYFRFDPQGGTWENPALPQRWKRVLPHPATIGHTVFRNLPLRVNRIAGTLIYPHLS